MRISRNKAAPRPRRIGIYAGTFNPVHTGHVAFALQALKEAKLDMIYFLPERRPRYKTGVEHFGHRVAMLKQALKPHPRFKVMELTDVAFTTERTLPKLRQTFGNSQLVFLFGSDIVTGLMEWPKVSRLLRDCELVIGLRQEGDRSKLEAQLAAWPLQPTGTTIFNSYAPEVSSGRIREALRRRAPVHGLLTSVERYSNRHWLYVSLA